MAYEKLIYPAESAYDSKAIFNEILPTEKPIES